MHLLRSRRQSSLGFTLIELLVVISIISLLSSMILAVFNTARGRARDARRISDLKSIATALELYFDDNVGYPAPAQGLGNWSGHCDPWGNNDTYITGISRYLATLPRDPRFDSNTLCYAYNSNGTDYMLVARGTMEAVVGGDASAAGNPPHIQALDRVCCTEPTIAIYTPGARGW
mgnify:CR=1 FL=1